jgi:hypothetical protein
MHTFEINLDPILQDTAKPLSTVPGSVVQFMFCLNKSSFIWVLESIVFPYPSFSFRTLNENDETKFQYISPENIAVSLISFFIVASQ